MVPARRSSDMPRLVGECDDILVAHRAILIKCTCWAIGIMLTFGAAPIVFTFIQQAVINGKVQIQVENLDEDVTEIKGDVKEVLKIVQGSY